VTSDVNDEVNGQNVRIRGTEDTRVNLSETPSPNVNLFFAISEKVYGLLLFVKNAVGVTLT
jgi:hypothetical protein